MADYRLVPCQRQEGSRGSSDYNLTPHRGTAYIYYKHQIPIPLRWGQIPEWKTRNFSLAEREETVKKKIRNL
jgi:hypothetical protein